MAYATQLGGGEGVAVADVVEPGPGLAFVAFPYALAQLPGAAWWSLIFFFTLVTLGIDSAFSITESVLAGLVDKTGWKRCFVLPLMSVIGLGFGLVFVTQSGLNWLGTIDDFINGTWGIAFLGLLECIALGWFYRVERLRTHANERSDWKLGVWWNLAIRVFIPVILGTLFVWNLLDDITKEGGFLKTPGPDGDWILFNCVGLCVMATVPIISIVLSLIKSPLPNSDGHGMQKTFKYPTSYAGFVISVAAFMMSLISTGVLGVLIYKYGIRGISEIPMLWIYYALAVGIIALGLGNYQLARLDRSSINPSVLSRWGGVIGTLDISTCIAFMLIMLTNTAVDAPKQVAADKLSSTSYIILGVTSALIVGGLSWCFWRAMTAPKDDSDVQRPSE
jgi:NSS family neurotransmitter:Na+ symporter